MTRKESLQELLVKVRAGGDASPFSGFSDDGLKLFTQGYVDEVQRAYRGSMDAALSLFEAVLPGWEWMREDDGEIVVFDDQSGDWGSHTCAAPSRALLIAILEALVVMEGG